jgi:hypothetical protein
MTSTAIQVADHIAHCVIGRGDLELHHRFEQDRLRLVDCGLEPHRAGDLESHLRRVDRVERPVVESDAHVLDGVAGDMPLEHRLANTLLHRRNEISGNDPTDDLVDELEALTSSERFHLQPAVAVLPAAAGLLLVFSLRVRLSLDRFSIRHLRGLEIDFDAVLSLQPFDDDLHVLLSGPGKNDLARLRIAVHA